MAKLRSFRQECYQMLISQRLFFYALILFVFGGCSKENSIPEVNVLLPQENTSFLHNENLSYQVLVEDEEGLIDLRVQLVNLAGETISEAQTYDLDGDKSKVVSGSFDLEDYLFKEEGVQIKFTASDGEETKNKYRKIVVFPTPRKRTGISVLTKSGSGLNLYFKADTSQWALLNSYTYQGGFDLEGGLSYEGFVVMPSMYSTIEMYDKDADLVKTIPFYQSFPNKSFHSISTDQNIFSISKDNGEVKRYGFNGLEAESYSLPQGYFARLSRNFGNLSLSQETNPQIPISKLVIRNQFGSVLYEETFGDSIMEIIDHGSYYFVFSKSGNKIKVEKFSSNGDRFTIGELSGHDFLSACRLGGKVYLSTLQGLYYYTPSTNGFILESNNVYYALEGDRVSNTLFAAELGFIEVRQGDSFNLIEQIPVPEDTIRGFTIQFNYY